MKITCIAHTDVGNQMYIISQAINRYTNHKARCITNTEMYLKFPTDIYYPTADKSEVKNVLEDSDFYIYSQYPIRYPEHRVILNRNNFIVALYGSHARDNRQFLLTQFLKYEFVFVSRPDISYCNFIPTIIIPNSIDFSMYPERVFSEEETIRICHSPTVREVKDTDYFLEIVKKLQKKYPVEVELIENTTWKECIERKKNCDITFDHLGKVEKIYGGNAYEGWVFSQPVLGSISPFVYVYYPTCPIINSTRDTLEENLENLLRNPDLIWEEGKKGRKYVYDIHSSSETIKKWMKLIEYVKER